MIAVDGKNTMYDVNIEMQEGEMNPEYMASHIREYLAGTLRPSYHFPSVSTTYSQPLGKEIHPDPKKINVYHFWVFSRTKMTSEVLQVKFDQDKDRWAYAFTAVADDGKTVLLDEPFDGKITRRTRK
jgi:hypothetical protein